MKNASFDPNSQSDQERSMHAAVFEAGWDSEGLMPQHRAVIAPEHRGQGREVISLDWTLSHHERGSEILGVNRAYDDVAHRMGRFQTVVTATITNRQWIDGIEVVAQKPDFAKAERDYLNMTAQENYTEMEQVRQQLIELLHYQKNRLEYRKSTEIAVDI